LISSTWAVIAAGVAVTRGAFALALDFADEGTFIARIRQA
jgi:hypothetical protein